jgi:dTDP-4-amino-4,6-dideoxygalactose transaminase
MDPIVRLAQEHGLAVVEDAAQAVLAEYRGRRTGSFGAVGCFSLHPLKTLSACGDGGALTTDDDGLAERLRLLRNLGLRTRDDCVVWSGNSRLDSIQAAILLVKLRYVDRWTEERRRNAAFYREALAGLPGIETPLERPDERSVYHTFVIQADRRDDLRAFLAERGVETAVHYAVPIHLQAAGRALGHAEGSLPVTERQAGRMVTLPVYPELGRKRLEYVAEQIRAFTDAG